MAATPEIVNRLLNRAFLIYRDYIVTEARHDGSADFAATVLPAVRAYAVAAGLGDNEAMNAVIDLYDAHFGVKTGVVA